MKLCSDSSAPAYISSLDERNLDFFNNRFSPWRHCRPHKTGIFEKTWMAEYEVSQIPNCLHSQKATRASGSMTTVQERVRASECVRELEKNTNMECQWQSALTSVDSPSSAVRMTVERRIRRRTFQNHNRTLAARQTSVVSRQLVDLDRELRHGPVSRVSRHCVMLALVEKLNVSGLKINRR